MELLQMNEWGQLFDEMEKVFQIRSVHNELKIVVILLENGPTPSLELHRACGRSISGHNSDLRRLRAIGVLCSETGQTDRREKIYDLEPEFRVRFVSFLEDCRTSFLGRALSLLRRPPRSRQKPTPAPTRRGRRSAK